MKKMITIAPGFQNSVNIAYDQNNEEKIASFIPTRAAMEFFQEILLSTAAASTKRAHVLIAPYGTGKSHMVLTTIGLLEKRAEQCFLPIAERMNDYPLLRQAIACYRASEGKLLPVIIAGSFSNLKQAFLAALQDALKAHGLENLMPETHYQAAVTCIGRWQKDYPAVYDQFCLQIDEPIAAFMDKMANYQPEAYQKFINLYPSLTAGGAFLPFSEGKIVDIYKSTIQELKNFGYQGIFVVYDEFSKFLEANILTAGVSDTKMLQDFAEMCNRSGENQLHLLLICHKEIGNYIDKLPKQKTDGWRGVAERFLQIRLENSYAQTYEIMETVIAKDNTVWETFSKQHKDSLDAVQMAYESHEMFRELTKEEKGRLIDAGYPLHPTTFFLLPRLSGEIAQNERTLFTFLASEGRNTLSGFLENQETFAWVLPDALYDYFAPLMEGEEQGGRIHTLFLLAQRILVSVTDSLSRRLLKTLALCYMVEQFDAFPPTSEELIRIFSSAHPVEEIQKALNQLIEGKYVVYLKRSNGFLRLKESSGVNIEQKIAEVLHQEKMEGKELLNHWNPEKYWYPTRYNDVREMVRYFPVVFLNSEEITLATDWDKKSAVYGGDGTIYAVLPQDEDISTLKTRMEASSQERERYIFIIPKEKETITQDLFRLRAVEILREKAMGDEVLYEEYNLMYQDMYTVVHEHIRHFLHPEYQAARFIHNGKEVKIHRRSDITKLLSDICDRAYEKTPVINNEVINKNELTAMALKSQHKVLAAILRRDVEPMLGLTGNGQEVSIFRSTILRTGLFEDDALPRFQLTGLEPNLQFVIQTIQDFLKQANEERVISFGLLYETLTGAKAKIGLRKGVIPLLLAVVMRTQRDAWLLADVHGEVSLTADVLQQINAKPEAFSLRRMNWNEEKRALVAELENVFGDWIQEAEKDADGFSYLAKAMQRWYLSLPRYTQMLSFRAQDKRLNQKCECLQKLLNRKQNSEFIFTDLPKLWKEEPEGITLLRAVKDYIEQALVREKEKLGQTLRELFGRGKHTNGSLCYILRDWKYSLASTVSEHVFADATSQFLTWIEEETPNDEQFIAGLARKVTGLYLEDWTESIEKDFWQQIHTYKENAESYQEQNITADTIENAKEIILSYPDADGKMVCKRLEPVAYSSRAKLLHNSLTANLSAMGQAISVQEKRQVLFDLLKALC